MQIISHDLSVVEHISDTLGVMYLGGLVETGSTEEIFANPPVGCKFHTRCPQCMECCKVEVPKARDMGNGHVVRCHLYNQNPEI